MDIEEFVNSFNDIIPYSFEIKIGGRRASHIKNDKNFISEDNRKGRVYFYYSKHLLGEKVEYMPIQEMNLPIELVVECSYPHNLLWEKRSDMTNKLWTTFEVRLLNDENKQFGFISIDLNASGDIKYKFCSYYNDDATHEIIQ